LERSKLFIVSGEVFKGEEKTCSKDQLRTHNTEISDDENENNVEHDVDARLIAHLHHVDGDNPPPNQKTGGFAGSKNPMLNENVSRIIRWYKGRCSFEMRKTNPNFGWQSRFYDHIIRNAASFDRIHNYIEDNPANWGMKNSKT
jgi:putative transposase